MRIFARGRQVAAGALVLSLVLFGVGFWIGRDADRPPAQMKSHTPACPAPRVVQVEFTGCLVWLERADKAPAGPVVFRVPLEMARPMDAEKRSRRCGADRRSNAGQPRGAEGSNASQP